MTDDYIEIESTVIAEVRTIRLYNETIDKVIEGHPEMPAYLPSLVDAVSLALTAPTHVEHGTAGSYVFVDGTTTNRSGDPLRVPVKIVEGVSARVKTFFFASKIVPVSAIVVWRRIGP